MLCCSFYRVVTSSFAMHIVLFSVCLMQDSLLNASIACRFWDITLRFFVTSSNNIHFVLGVCNTGAELP